LVSTVSAQPARKRRLCLVVAKLGQVTLRQRVTARFAADRPGVRIIMRKMLTDG